MKGVTGCQFCDEMRSMCHRLYGDVMQCVLEKKKLGIDLQLWILVEIYLQRKWCFIKR